MSIAPRSRRAGIALSVGVALALAIAPAVGAAQAADGRPSGTSAVGGAAFDVHLVKTGLYLIEGGGANALLRFSANGMILIDAKLPGRYRALTSQVHRLGRFSDQPLRVLLLTGSDEARAGNAAQFLAAGVSIVAQRKVVTHLPAPAAGAKAVTVAFDDAYTLRLGGVETRLLHFGSAYSNADAIVHFPDLKVVALGALFVPDAADAPMPDFAAGGSLVNWAPVLDQVLKLDFDIAVGASGGPQTRHDLEAFKARIEILVAQARALVREGVAPEDFAARLQTAMPEWNVRFTREQLAALVAEIGSANDRSR